MIQKLKNFLKAWKINKPKTQGSNMTEQEIAGMNHEDLQLVAQLVGQTAGELKDVDKKMIDDGSATNRALRLDPKTIVRDALRQVRPQGVPVPVPQYQQPIPPPMQHSPPTATFAPPGVNVQSVVMLDANAINQFSQQIAALGTKMDTLISQIEILKTVEARFTESLERTLNKGAKTVTFKFDDTQLKPAVNTTTV